MYFKRSTWCQTCLGIACLLYLAISRIYVAGELLYSCYPNDTIIVDNPGNHIWYRADNNETACNITLNANDQFIITGCEKDIPIALVLSNRTDTSTEIIYGRRENDNIDLVTYEITCDEIPIEGLNRTVPVGLTPSIPATMQETVSPSFTLTSFIYVNASKEELAETAKSGDELYWNIRGAAEYDHKPEECIAYAGLVITPTVSNKTIINAGCSLDSSLVSNFSFTNGSGDEVFSYIYAFRFISSEYVTFECRVRVCPSNESSCAIDCSDDRRRREADLSDNEEMDIVTTRIRVLPRITEQVVVPRSESTTLGSELWWMLGVAVILKTM